MRSEPLRQLAGCGSFAGALQACDHPNRRRAQRKKRLGGLPEQQRQLIAYNFDDLLIRRELQQHFRAERLLTNVYEQFVDDADVNVAFEQRFTNSRKRFVDVLLSEFSLPAQVLENALQFVG